MARGRLYVGLAIVTAATIFAEITLTRILSVILWYHFAFVAISLAMLGMAGGAMYVYLHRERFPAEQSLPAMGRATFWFAVTLAGAYVLTLGVWVRMSTQPAALVALLMLVALWGVPFFLYGVVVSRPRRQF